MRRPVILGPPHPWAWLTDDPDHRDYCAREVILADLDPAEKLRRCELYRDRWGIDELTAAIRYAARLAPLGPGMAGVLRDLTRREVA